jgi:hypothetical protein
VFSQVTSRPAAVQHLRDLARLRGVRDRIDLLDPALHRLAQPARAGSNAA